VFRGICDRCARSSDNLTATSNTPIDTDKEIHA
jgi:hypothetical protein